MASLTGVFFSIDDARMNQGENHGVADSLFFQSPVSRRFSKKNDSNAFFFFYSFLRCPPPPPPAPPHRPRPSPKPPPPLEGTVREPEGFRCGTGSCCPSSSQDSHPCFDDDGPGAAAAAASLRDAAASFAARRLAADLLSRSVAAGRLLAVPPPRGAAVGLSYSIFSSSLSSSSGFLDFVSTKTASEEV